MTPEEFGTLMVADFINANNNATKAIATQIANSIKQQCASWQASVTDTEDSVMVVTQEELEMNDQAIQDSDWRAVIKLDLHVGDLHLQDSFEWPLAPQVIPVIDNADQIDPNVSTPEGFARILCADLGLASEFVGLIAHQIREQLYTARINFDETDKVAGLPENANGNLVPFRHGAAADGPVLEDVDQEEMERREREHDRATRRHRRSQRQGLIANAIVLDRADHVEYETVATRSARANARGSSLQPQQLPQVQQSQQQQQQFHPYQMPAQFAPQDYSQFQSASLQQSQLLKPTPTKVPYRNYKPSKDEEEAVMKKLEEAVDLKNLPPVESPPKAHRGFGASAGRFNENGDVEVGEFREKWRCSWCLLSGKYTPTLRKGPMGSKTLCNACGIWFGKHRTLPEERYHEHMNSES